MMQRKSSNRTVTKKPWLPKPPAPLPVTYENEPDEFRQRILDHNRSLKSTEEDGEIGAACPDERSNGERADALGVPKSHHGKPRVRPVGSEASVTSHPDFDPETDPYLGPRSRQELARAKRGKRKGPDKFADAI